MLAEGETIFPRIKNNPFDMSLEGNRAQHNQYHNS